MQSKTTTVEAYLAELPADRRAAVEAVRAVILKNLDPTIREGMQYGMIGYFVPHSVYPAGYHCDAKQPLPMAGLASQKGHLSLYLMGLYCGCGVPGLSGKDGLTDYTRWFQSAWEKTGKKLDMGKACIRFKKVEEIPLEVIGEAFKRMSAKEYIALYTTVLGTTKTGKTTGKTTGKETASKTAGKTAKKAAKKAAKKVAKKVPTAAKKKAR
jgi:hypothetical protein